MSLVAGGEFDQCSSCGKGPGRPCHHCFYLLHGARHVAHGLRAASCHDDVIFNPHPSKVLFVADGVARQWGWQVRGGWGGMIEHHGGMGSQQGGPQLPHPRACPPTRSLTTHHELPDPLLHKEGPQHRVLERRLQQHPAEVAARLHGDDLPLLQQPGGAQAAEPRGLEPLCMAEAGQWGGARWGRGVDWERVGRAGWGNWLLFRGCSGCWRASRAVEATLRQHKASRGRASSKGTWVAGGVSADVVCVQPQEVTQACRGRGVQRRYAGSSWENNPTATSTAAHCRTGFAVQDSSSAQLISAHRVA